jgi:Cu(I)/Ag(I) efflux system membrane fusion protein
MSPIRTTLVAGAAALLAAGSFLLGRAGMPRGEPQAMAPPAAAPAAPASAERKVLYWHDPMVPGQRFDKPGKSPFMDMQLVPVYADESGAAGVKVSAALQQNLGIRTVPVKRADVSTSFDAVGTVQFDERLAVAVQTRVAGYVERLAVRAPMEQVRKGQALATVFAPDWLGPLNELVALKRAGVSPELLAAARDRTRALSIPAELVTRAEETGDVDARYTLHAPASGVVAELGVREGMAVTPGMTLFRIAGLERVWAVAEVPEAQAVRLMRGQKVKAVLQADASQSFVGVLKEILPQVSAATRTLQARFEVGNPGARLIPGLLLRLEVAGPTASRLVVPAEAVIRTGTRAVAIVRRDDGTFEPRDVTLGAELGDTLEVAQGLQEGEQVVASGQFLVDSEARLRSVLGAMSASGESRPGGSGPGASGSGASNLGAAGSTAPPAASAAAPGRYVAQGKVESVDADSITISHGPVAELQWPAMTMSFGKRAPQDFGAVKPGDEIRFEFRKGGPLAYELVSVQRTGAVR